MKVCGIYVIVQKSTGRMYVGKSADIHRRWKDYRREIRKYTTEIFNALRAYGFEAFEWRVLEECSFDALNDREMWWIKELRAFEIGFNHTPGGDGMQAGGKHSAEANEAKSVWSRGKPHSVEHNAAVSVALTGRIVPRAHTDRMTAALKNHVWVFSEDHRRKISEAKTGKKMPDGVAQKVWEIRRKNGTDKGWRLSEEIKQRMSAAKLVDWANRRTKGHSDVA